MKLVRYGNPGKEKPGLIDDNGQLRDLSAVVKDLGPDQLGDAALAKLRKLKTDKLPLVRGKPRLGSPIANVGKFIAIGLNYADHAAESGMPIPKEPVVFTKATSCIQGPNDPVMLPKNSVKSDWEVELGVVIGTRARYVSQKDALDYVAGYCIINDVSEREWQMEHGLTWDKGKGFDTFGPLGPWLVTRDEVPNPQKLGMWLDLNGQRMQTGNTRTMIFNVAKLVSYQHADARRRHHHRYAARRRHGHEAADVPEEGRRDDPRYRGPGRTAPGSGRLQALIDAA